MAQISRNGHGERGITILLVAVAMVSILAMAALAVDLVALYVARTETQRTADAAALAAAKMFVFSGYTSNPSSITTFQLCGVVGSTAAANQAAQSVAAQNRVAGQAASLQAITCDFSQAENPRVTVTIQRTGLPTFFGRIWGTTAGSVSATASAEAFNPSGGTVNIAVGSVKPWLVNNNCAPGSVNPLCATGHFYFTPSYTLTNSGAFIGTQITLAEADNTSSSEPSGPNEYYAIDPPQPNACPSNSAVQCNNIGTGPPGIFYHDNIACANTAFQYSCGQQIGPGQPVQVDTRSTGFINTRTEEGTECLIHASSTGTGQGQDVINLGPPITIDGGTNNPNPALRPPVSNISRSDSVVTVPVYDGSNLCSGSTCNVTTQILGFLQLGIQAVDGTGHITAVILNASGCNPANTGIPVAGGAVSPIPVRLIHQ